jgi:hypothetical protein
VTPLPTNIEDDLNLTYYLTQDTYLCGKDDTFAFLNLKADRYTLVSGPEAAALKALLFSKTEALADSSFLKNALPALVAHDLLTTDHSQGKPVATTSTSVATLRVRASFNREGTRIKSSHVFWFMHACFLALVQLRCFPLLSTVNGMKRRKHNAPTRDCADDRVRNLAIIFGKLRRFFPANYLCLFDSLALVNFLASYGHYPDWVFGVNLDPWSAHCWVQSGQFVLNDDPETVASFIPILAV